MTTQKEAIQSFSKAAHTYEQSADIQRYVGDKLISSINVQDPTHILDLGCGTGFFTKKLAKQFPNSQIIAIDISDPMIGLAKRVNNIKNINYIQSNISDYQFSEKEDILFSNAAFQWVNSPRSIFKTISDCAKPGFKAYISVFGPNTFNELSKALNACLSYPVKLDSESFLRIQEWQNIVNPLFDQVSLKQDLITKVYPNSLALLKHIKNTGTQGRDKKINGLWTKSTINKLDSFFNENYGEVQITYQIYYLTLSNAAK